jgi:hypothetical protein
MTKPQHPTAGWLPFRWRQKLFGQIRQVSPLTLLPLLECLRRYSLPVMQSAYTPVFPKSTIVITSDWPASSSSTSSVDRRSPLVSYIDDLGGWHCKYAMLPEVLHPPSSQASGKDKEAPFLDFESRSKRVADAVRQVVLYAQGDPTSPSWEHMSKPTRLQCISSRKYPIIPSKPPVLETSDERIGPLAETEEEWLEWEAGRAKSKEQQQRQRVVDMGNLGTLHANYLEKVEEWKATLPSSSSRSVAQEVGSEAPKPPLPASISGPLPSHTDNDTNKKRASQAINGDDVPSAEGDPVLRIRDIPAGVSLC